MIQLLCNHKMNSKPVRTHHFPQVSAEEREELHTAHTSQDSSVRRASLQRQRLLDDVARLNQLLHAKDQVIRWVYFYGRVQYRKCTQEGAL